MDRQRLGLHAVINRISGNGSGSVFPDPGRGAPAGRAHGLTNGFGKAAGTGDPALEARGVASRVRARPFRRDRGMGWLRDNPSIRDYGPRHEHVSLGRTQLGQTESVRGMLAKTGAFRRGLLLPSATDLREWFPPADDQGRLQSGAAHAALSLLAYFEYRAWGAHLDASRRFLYRTARTLAGTRGDVGVNPRSALEALVRFGAPPERHWPEDAAAFDEEPPAFCYGFAPAYQALSYYRLDSAGVRGPRLLARIRRLLAAGLPSLLGFTVHGSITQDGAIPFPTAEENILGGQVVVAAGYDDRRVVANPDPIGPETRGALLVRNSWGEDWGEAGYGWLPYEYVLRGLTADHWSLIRDEWIETGEFHA